VAILARTYVHSNGVLAGAEAKIREAQKRTAVIEQDDASHSAPQSPR
jgi:hypothetical protein